jgi:hypothetical protein
VVAANVVVEAPASSLVTCRLQGGGEAIAKASLGVGESATLSLTLSRSLGAAGASSVSCEASGGASVSFVSLVATQVKSQSRVAL